MNVLAVAALLLSVQEPVLELDHVYIVAPPGATAGLQALRQAGLTIDSAVNKHEGQGTASVAAFFENGYLELLWVDSSVTVDSLHRQDWADFVRARDWRRTGASPFGAGLHFVSGAVSDLGIPVRIDSAGHLRPGAYYVLLRQPAESLAPDLFIMPDFAAVPAWIGRFASRHPERLAHPLGVHRITRATLRGPAPQRARAAGLQYRVLSFAAADSSELVLEFDGGRQHKSVDLRPALPLVLVY